MKQLPIDAVIPELLAALAKSRNAVLIAEPGAGKTTRVPLALLGEEWLNGQRIIMLEPRRLAARSAAQYMAELLGEEPGETVGFRVRQHTRVGPRTKIEVVTEGVLTRMLQTDPALEGVGAILFDEFHERHLQSDLGLALSLQSQALLRDDLRLLVMSATLDAEPIAALLGDVPIIRSAGRVFPVETHYLYKRNTLQIEQATVTIIKQALAENEGDVLVFLPGTGEIRRTAALLQHSRLQDSIHIVQLHGNLPLEKQRTAIKRCQSGERKIVLATSIAESSVTVDGVTVVVDSGLMRVPSYSPRTGMTTLETIPVSQASANQRRGRAGRLAPGVCYRLWTEQEQPYLPKQGTPEIAEAELSPLALELAVWGVKDPTELQWLTPPPSHLYVAALELLHDLNAIDARGKPTSDGHTMAELGIHPRLGAMLLKAADKGWLHTACQLAALLSEKDLLPQERSVDISLRLQYLNSGRMIVQEQNEAAVKRAAVQAAAWEKAIIQKLDLPIDQISEQEDAVKGAKEGVLIAYAYPDRIAQRRQDGRYLLANGRGAFINEKQQLSYSNYLAVCELDGSGADSRIRLAAELSIEDIERHLPFHWSDEIVLEWDQAAQAARARSKRRLGAIIIKEQPAQASSIDQEQLADLLLEAVQTEGFGMLPMNKQAHQLLARMQVMSLSGSDWPVSSKEALLSSLDSWLRPHIYGLRSRAELQKLNMVQLLEGMLSWSQKQELDQQVPTHITVPSGSRIPVDYSDPQMPVLAVRLQELFGLKETPRLARGILPVMLHLLSPAHRPVQVTQDLQSFWENTYFEIKKDLKGRYPKHYWPDDPLIAEPTNRAKPRK